MPELGC